MEYSQDTTTQVQSGCHNQSIVQMSWRTARIPPLKSSLGITTRVQSGCHNSSVLSRCHNQMSWRTVRISQLNSGCHNKNSVIGSSHNSQVQPGCYKYSTASMSQLQYNQYITTLDFSLDVTTRTQAGLYNYSTVRV